MKKISKKVTLLFSILALVVIFVACDSNNDGSSSSGASNVSLDGVPEVFQREQRPRLMVIRQIGGDDHTAQFLAGAQREGEALGFDVTTFTANGNTPQFHDAIAQAIQEGYDAFVISHGSDDATVGYVRQIVESGASLVAFDSHGDIADIDGATLTSQDDVALAQHALDALVASTGGEGNIIYLWVDGFPPMVRRNVVYQSILDANPGLNEIGRFGVAADDTTLQTQNAVNAMLISHGVGEIDAIFATWDAFALGATQALTESGREEIPIFGIDISNQALQIMQEENSPWKYSAAVDPALVGAVTVRIAAMQLAGYDTPDTYDLEAALISQSDLLASNEPVNMVTLADVIPGWGQSDSFNQPWMDTLREFHGR